MSAVSVEGPVELIDGKLTLRIPLSLGGTELLPITQAIGGHEERDYFVVVISRLARCKFYTTLARSD